MVSTMRVAYRRRHYEDNMIDALWGLVAVALAFQVIAEVLDAANRLIGSRWITVGWMVLVVAVTAAVVETFFPDKLWYFAAALFVIAGVNHAGWLLASIASWEPSWDYMFLTNKELNIALLLVWFCSIPALFPWKLARATNWLLGALPLILWVLVLYISTNDALARLNEGF